MKVAISYWGICENFQAHRHVKLDTPDGHRYGRPIFVKELLRRGHSVIMMQERREEFCFRHDEGTVGAHGIEYCMEPPAHAHSELGDSSVVGNKFPDIDVLFLEWRWSTYKNDRRHPDHIPSKYEPDLDRQLELIEFYRNRCPIIVWDTDLKVTPEDERRWPELILTDPSLETNRLTRDRISLPFWTDWEALLPTSEPYPIVGLVGNNYERAEEFQKFYFNVQSDARAAGLQVSMYGNWLQRSPERESPEALIARNPFVAFNHRMNFFDSMCMMNRFVCTTHVSKPRYYETGFISPRYMEALAMNCPALVPRAQIVNSILGNDYIVDSGADVFRKAKEMKLLSVEQRAALVNEQRDNMKKMGKFDVSTVVDFIENCID